MISQFDNGNNYNCMNSLHFVLNKHFLVLKYVKQNLGEDIFINDPEIKF